MRVIVLRERNLFASFGEKKEGKRERPKNERKRKERSKEDCEMGTMSMILEVLCERAKRINKKRKD